MRFVDLAWFVTLMCHPFGAERLALPRAACHSSGRCRSCYCSLRGSVRRHGAGAGYRAGRARPEWCDSDGDALSRRWCSQHSSPARKRRGLSSTKQPTCRSVRMSMLRRCTSVVRRALVWGHRSTTATSTRSRARRSAKLRQRLACATASKRHGCRSALAEQTSTIRVLTEATSNIYELQHRWPVFRFECGIDRSRVAASCNYQVAASFPVWSNDHIN
ncbi:hypothetical protein BLA18110_06364 [Burkholderia lata]|nr:hypothetical protein BLA18110_06364 [Burkholderia lata]